MSGKKKGPAEACLHVATLVAISIGSSGLLLGCGSSDSNGGASSANDGAGGSPGGGTGNGSGGGGGVSSSAGGTGLGGVGPGGNGGGMGGTPGGGVSTGGAGGGSAGGSSVGGASNSGGSTGVGGSSGGGNASDGGSALSCQNPTHTLPLNPQNPQDGITLSGFYVDTDTWNAANYTVSQTMYVCDYNDWYVVAKMDDSAHDGAVKTYPNVHKDFDSSPLISSFTTISSSFAHEGPHVGIYEFAYDIWLNGIAGGGSTEIMIWTDNYKQTPSGSVQDTVTFDGASWDVYKSGSYIAFVAKKNVTLGTVNLLSFFNYVIGKTWIPSDSTLGAIDYGVELVSTNGADATFSVTDFSLTTN